MTWKSLGLVRILSALLAVHVLSACPAPNPPPPARDTTPPTTRAAPAGGSFSAPVSVTLLCDDGGGSGCAATYYATDGSEPTTGSTRYTAPIAVSATTPLKFFSVDGAGNAEAVKTEQYTFDTSAPTVSASPRGGTYGSAQTVSLSCDDAGGTGCAAIRYTTDGSAPTVSSPVYSAPLVVGTNTALRFFATDAAGNASAQVTETYVIDVTGPATTATPAGGFFAADVSVQLSCDDANGSGCAATYYTTNGSSPTPASTLYTGPVLLTTTTTLKFFSVDAVGHAGPVVTQEYTFDRTAPTTGASPAGGSYDAVQNVTLSCDDGSGSGCANTHYTVNGSQPTPASPVYSGPIRVGQTTTLKFFSVDQVGNAEPVKTQVYTLSIDSSAPQVSASPAGGAYATARSVTLSCDDGGGSGCASIRYTTNGSTPTTSSTQYTAPLNISSNTTLKFLAIDNAGNVSSVVTETYVIDSSAPQVSASPAGGSYATTQSVTLSCDDGGGSGCASIRYTTDGSTPTTSSTQYTAPLSISSTTTLKFLAIDNVGNVSSVVTETYVIDSSAMASAQIAAVRGAADGSLNLPIEQALVTYLKPAVGTEPAGFFLQAQQSGPALFVAVAPSSLTPAPMVGDRVSLVVTQKTTTSQMSWVTALSGFTVNSQGHAVAPLRADVSTLDVPGLLSNHESELITITGTLTGTFSASSTGYVQANMSTAGVPSSSGLALRLPTSLQDQLDVNKGCDITANSPLWRVDALAQPSGWYAEDISVLSCPAPEVVAAAASSPTQLKVTFDRFISPASVMANGSQFTFNNGLTATAASVSGREVLLTTTTQVGGQSYTVTVATSVRDTRGTALNASAASAPFTGYSQSAVLRITELAPNITPNGRDLIELYAVQGGSVDGFTVVQDAITRLVTLPNVQVATGDIIVVHFNPDTASGFDAPGSETTSKSQYPSATHASNYNNAWDFHGGSVGFNYSSRVVRVKDAQGNTQDGVAFARTSGTPPASYPEFLQALQAEGQWLPATCGGVPCTYTSTPTALEVSAVWEGVSTDRTVTARRVSSTDTDHASDWGVGASSLGSPNP